MATTKEDATPEDQSVKEETAGTEREAVAASSTDLLNRKRHDEHTASSPLSAEKYATDSTGKFINDPDKIDA